MSRPIFGSSYLVNETKSFLLAQMTLLRGIIETKKLKGRADDIKIMLATLINTGNGIAVLANDGQRFYGECVMLARGFFEKITNISYLLICTEEEFKDCLDHALYRHYLKGSDNEKVIKNEKNEELFKLSMSMSNIESFKQGSEYKRAIEKFNNRKQTRFPVPKIEKRLGCLAEKTKMNIPLFLAYQQAYYDDSSEALHGSFYGSIFHFLNIDFRSKEVVFLETNKNLSLLLWQTGEFFHQLIILLRESCDIEEFYSVSVKNSSTTLHNVKVAMEHREPVDGLD